MAERKHVDGNPLISIVTLHYNQAKVTLEFLESTRSLTYPNVEVIVVDNGSPEQPLSESDVARFPHVRLISSPKNLGFAGGNNLGMRQAKGDFLLLLNNDTEVTPNLIEELLIPFRTDASIGVVSPKIRYFSNPTVIQYAGYRPLNPYRGGTLPYGNLQTDTGQCDQSGPTNFAHGAAMMVRRDVAEKTGMFEEKYFLYFEELDWSHRIRQAGYQLYYQASALIYHKESISVGKASPLKVYYQTRNRIYFMRRCTTWWQQFVFTLFFSLAATPKHLTIYVSKGQMQHFKAYLRGIAWNFTH